MSISTTPDGQCRKIVAVTGFGLFGRFTGENPSWTCVKELSTFPFPPGVELQIRCVPVDYENVEAQANDIWQNVEPDFVLHVGVNEHLSDSVAIERQAFNFGYCTRDVNVPLDNCYSKKEFSTLVTCVNIPGIVEHLKECELESEVSIFLSDDPGRYLCGYLYFSSLTHDPSKVLFVHVPCFSAIATARSVAEVLYQPLPTFLTYFIF
ncbi:pyroglutamyl-peptidase I [Trichuris suis]|nr:pyroglutamyl-peptidase I [Trichuris suis]